MGISSRPVPSRPVTPSPDSSSQRVQYRWGDLTSSTTSAHGQCHARSGRRADFAARSIRFIRNHEDVADSRDRTVQWPQLIVSVAAVQMSTLGLKQRAFIRQVTSPRHIAKKGIISFAIGTIDSLPCMAACWSYPRMIRG